MVGNISITDMYMSVLSSLSVDEKLDLIAKLTNSIRNTYTKDRILKQKILLLVTKAIGAEICRLRNMQMIYVSPNLRVYLSYIQLLQR